MSRKEFELEFTVRACVQIDGEHLEEIMSEDWAKSYYTFDDKAEALSYVTRLLMLTGSLSRHDGHAHMPKSVACLTDLDIVDDNVEILHSIGLGEATS